MFCFHLCGGCIYAGKSRILLPDITSTSPEVSVVPADAEIRKAVELGFVSDELLNDMGAQISYAEFCGVLDAVLAEARPECVDAWETRSAGFRDQALE